MDTAQNCLSKTVIMSSHNVCFGGEKKLNVRNHHNNTLTGDVALIFIHYKNAYSNILKILPPKTENFQIKYSDILHISVQNIDYGYALEPPW